MAAWSKDLGFIVLASHIFTQNGLKTCAKWMIDSTQHPLIPEPISSDPWQSIENQPFPTLSVISDRSELSGIGIRGCWAESIIHLAQVFNPFWVNIWLANTMKPRSFDHAAMIYMFCSDVLTERPRLIHVSCLPFSSMSFYSTMYDHVCCTHTCMHNRAVDR